MNQHSGKFLAVTAVLVYLAVFGSNCLLTTTITAWYRLLFNATVVFFLFIDLIMGIISGALIFLPISKLHTFSSAIKQVAFLTLAYLFGYIGYRKLVKASKEPRKAQHDLLMDILAKGVNSEFGQKMGFANIKTMSQYQAAVPLSTYDDYRPYIERIEKGEENVLTSNKVIKISVSSGTTAGKCKHLPYVELNLKRTASEYSLPLVYRFLWHYRFPANIAPLKVMEMTYIPNWRYSECGLPIGPVSAMPGKRNHIMSLIETTPSEAIVFMSEPAQSYIHWLFGLIDNELKAVTCIFAGTLLANMEFFQKNWKQLADDIRHGHITNSHNIPSEIIQVIENMPIFKVGNPRRADEIETACSKGFEGILKRLWPRLDTVVAACTGAHAIFQDRIRWYAGKDVFLLSIFYGASEGMFAMPVTNQQENDFTYTFLVRLTFFEFIPEQDIDKKDPRVLFVDQLEVGKRYELVITSHNGLYRYRMNDILKVVSFYNNTPVLEFCSRVGSILDLRGEKTSEDMVISALKIAVPKWKDCNELAEFTATDSLTLENTMEANYSGQLYYALFIESANDTFSRPLSESEIAEFDEALCTMSYPYKSFRAKAAISKPKIFVVRRGTFEELKLRILETNKAISNQFKMPRYQKRPEFIRLLINSAFK